MTEPISSMKKPKRRGETLEPLTVRGKSTKMDIRPRTAPPAKRIAKNAHPV